MSPKIDPIDFIRACVRDDIEVVKLFAEQGGDINLLHKPLLIPQRDICSYSGYEFALKNSASKVCEFLLNHPKFKVNTLNDRGLHIFSIDASIRHLTFNIEIMRHRDFSWDSTDNRTIPLIATLERHPNGFFDEVIETQPHVNGRYRIKLGNG